MIAHEAMRHQLVFISTYYSHSRHRHLLFPLITLHYSQALQCLRSPPSPQQPLPFVPH